MKTIFAYLIFVIVVLFSCSKSTTLAKGEGVKVTFSGVGEASIEKINNRFSSGFPDVSVQMNNGKLEVESGKLIPISTLKKMVSGNGIVQLKPTVNNSLILHENLIQKVKLEMSPSGTSQIMIRMTALGAKKWYQLTKANVGQVIEVFVDENSIVAPTVNSPITGGVTSLFGKNEMETKMLYSLIKFPILENSNVSVEKREIYIKDGNGDIQKVPHKLIEKYQKNRAIIKENESGIITFIQGNALMDNKAKSMLERDIKRMVSSEFETYLSETQLNLDQCKDVLQNVEKLISSYETRSQ